MRDFSSRLIVAMLACAVELGGLRPVQAQSTPPLPPWMPITMQQAESVQVLLDAYNGVVPPTIPQTLSYLDGTGSIGSYQPAGSINTADNAFFAAGLGGSTNGRTCFTCHQPQDGWGLKPATVLLNYLTTRGKSPLFQPVDGADCPSLITANQTPAQFVATHQQMLTKANTRIFLAENPTHDWFQVTAVNDPTTCEKSAQYGLNASPPFASFYRRPLPTANIAFQDPQGPGPFVFIPSVNNTPFSIMWDSREPTLQSQFNDAVMIHAQGTGGATTAEIDEGVEFQDGIFAAQSLDFKAGDLTGGDGSGATGGPLDLAEDALNSTFSFPALLGNISFSLYDTPGFSSPLSGPAPAKAQRESIARGEAIFNSRNFSAEGVDGLNNIFTNPLEVTCSACHNVDGAGNDFFLAIFHTGIGDNSSVSPDQSTATALQPTPDMPLLSFWCPVGSIPFFSNPKTGSDGNTYDVFETEDPGYGWISGKCSDLGMMKVPVLRGLASRAPYFHGGEAKTLADLVNFYNVRFSIGLSAKDQQDLVNFLNTL